MVYVVSAIEAAFTVCANAILVFVHLDDFFSGVTARRASFARRISPPPAAIILGRWAALTPLCGPLTSFFALCLSLGPLPALFGLVIALVEHSDALRISFDPETMGSGMDFPATVGVPLRKVVAVIHTLARSTLIAKPRAITLLGREEPQRGGLSATTLGANRESG